MRNHFLRAATGKGLWTPAQITTALWLDAADNTTVFSDAGTTQAVAGTSTVQQWSDKSGNGQHVSQATTGNRPAYAANAINSKPVIRLSNSTNTNLRKITHTLPTGSSPWTYVLVCKGRTANTEIFGWGSNSGSGSRAGIYFYNLALSLESANPIHAGANFPTDAAVAAGSFTGGTISNYLQWVNGSSDALALIGSNITMAITNTELAIGAIPGAQTLSPSIDVGEIIIVAGAPSTDTRQRVEGYLAHKWDLTANLPSNHPYKTVAP